jgi:predicted permease
MRARLRAIGGVLGVELTQPTLLEGGVNTTNIFVQGRTYESTHVLGRGPNSIHRLVVSSGFFDLMQMPMVMGRGFTESDTETAAKVAVINEAAARKFFPNQNPIGRRFGSSVDRSDEIEVVGVLRDAKYNSLRDPAPPTLYMPYQQRPDEPSFVVRTAGEPTNVVGAIREAVREIDPTLPITEMTTQMEQVERRFEQEKLFARAYMLFGALALLLASVGLFGLMSFNVSRRTTEIGLRMALGAQRNHVLRLVLGESMLLVSIGIALGLGIAIVAGRLAASLLFGIAPTDVFTMAFAMSLMWAVAAVAGYVPARHALSIDPMSALREE